jgi:LemA protein
MHIMAPKNKWELSDMIKFALEFDGPMAIRYPRGTAYDGLKEYREKIEMGRSEPLYEGREVAILALGSMVETGEKVHGILKEKGIESSLINVRFVKPVDRDMIIREAEDKKLLVTMEENVNAKFSEIDNQYQRRSDLVPNLVETVKGAGERESKTLTDVIEARAKATSVTIDASNLTEENLAAYQKAQGELGMALSRLMAVSEAYPDLKANTNFIDLQNNLKDTEDKISYARQFYNDSVLKYNNLCQQFPSSIVASLFHFDKADFFEAQEGTRAAPKVQF